MRTKKHPWTQSPLCLIKNNYPHNSIGPQRLPVSHVKQIPSVDLGPKWPINMPHKGGGSLAVHRGETLICRVTLWLKIRLVGLGQGRAPVRRDREGLVSWQERISRARFTDAGWISVGTIDASFEVSLTFDLSIGFTTPLTSACK